MAGRSRPCCDRPRRRRLVDSGLDWARQPTGWPASPARPTGADMVLPALPVPAPAAPVPARPPETNIARATVRPNDLLLVATRQIELKLHDQALEKLRRVAHGADQSAAITASFMMASVYGDVGEAENAMGAYVEIASRFPASPRAAEALVRLAETTLKSKGRRGEDAASRTLTEAARKYPRSAWAPPALLMRGDIEARQGVRQRDPLLGGSVPVAAITYRELADRYPSTDSATRRSRSWRAFTPRPDGSPWRPPHSNVWRRAMLAIDTADGSPRPKSTISASRTEHVPKTRTRACCHRHRTMPKRRRGWTDRPAALRPRVGGQSEKRVHSASSSSSARAKLRSRGLLDPA